MKKLFTSLVVASTAATLAACGKTATTDTKTTTEKQNQRSTPPPPPPPVVVGKGNVAKGNFKVGYAGSNTAFTKNLKDTLIKYTQDATTKSAGDEYFKLPSGLSLLSSDKFNSYVRESQEYKDEVNKLRTYLLKTVRFGVDNQKSGYPANKAYKKFTHYDAPISGLITSGTNRHNTEIIIVFDTQTSGVALNASNALETFDSIFSKEKIKKLYEVLTSKTANAAELKTALENADIEVSTDTVIGFTAASPATVASGKGGTLYINIASSTLEVSGVDKIFKTVEDDFKTKSEEALDDKTKLAAKNVDALFVQVTNGVENSAEVYKAVVERKEFGATKLFFVGDKAKSQSGASSKVFAGGHVSTASFNKYAAAYVAGFQTAVGTIKYSSSEDVYEETTTSFLIGSTSDSEAKKKAFAFRRGVEAATAHGAYSKYLKVKFVSKSEDSSKSSKKLYREVSEWKAKDGSNSKLYEFSSSDTFSDADRRVIYLAGTTARDWTGYKAATIGTNSDLNQFVTGDEVGLIGALYNYEALPTSAKSANSLTTKTYARGVWVILDEANSGTAANDNAQKTDNGDLSQVTTVDKGRINFERHDVKFYGAIGKETAGTTQYATAALKGLYMGGPNYMLGKHTIFGAQLNLNFVTKSTGNARGAAGAALAGTNPTAFEYGVTTQSIWAAVKGKKDSTSKAKDRFITSLTHAWEKEVTEAELTKASPWLK